MSRLKLLDSLLKLSSPINGITKKLSELNWDYNACIILNKKHIKSILLRYVSHKLNEQEVEIWANAIESREDIEYYFENKDQIIDIIFELANPLLTTQLIHERAFQILERL